MYTTDLSHEQSFNNEIVAQNLVKNYTLKESRGPFKKKAKKSITAVDGISLHIPQGNIIGVLGINGAGKTTTIRMLSSMVEPTSGQLTLNGKDAVKNHLWVKERVNIISGGERNLYWRLTARENLAYFGSLYGLGKNVLKQRTEELLKIVGLEDVSDIPVERYSKGMKQRLQIARGLINDPEYIFLDEPTLGLDIVIAQEIRKLIFHLAKEKKKGILLTTHYIREAEELCDYIYVLDKGKIIAQGTKEELKEIFQNEPLLMIKIKENQTESLQNIMSKLNTGIEMIYENGEITIPGNPDQWSSVLGVLIENRIEILNMDIQEPNLEEILMKIIHQSRGKSIET
ncbi:MAG: ABC transporter ATP-binding protein [Coprococcus sp.]|nr:ABC transporter ATP-binding protein [Coprococcus sp.]